MMMTIVWILVGLGVLAAALGILLMRAGRKIPVEHQATSVIDIHASIERVFEAIADIRSHPTWARGVKSVEQIQDKGEMEAVRIRIGHNTFVMVQTRCEPPIMLERTITDARCPFSGTWLYRLRSFPGDGPMCEVKLTETGRVNQPAFRALMKYVFGYHMNTHRHLRDLAGKFEPHPGRPRRG